MIDRTSLKLCLTSLALAVSAPLFAQSALAAPSQVAGKDLVKAVAAAEAQVSALENEVISTQQALDEAKSAKPVDQESIACAKEANTMAKTNLAIARKNLAAERSALAKADKANGGSQTRLASGSR